MKSDIHTPTHVVIIGASGHGRVIADIIRCSNDIVDGFLDDRDADQFPGLHILGRVHEATALSRNNALLKFIIGIGRNETRKAVTDRLTGLHYYTAVHPSAVVAGDTVIGEGCAVMANAVVNTGAVAGSHCIINTAATVDHDCILSDYVHLSPGVHLSGAVEIGSGSWLGIGTVVSNNIQICSDCTIGAGAVVIKNIDAAGTYVGVPATNIRRT